VFWFVKHGGVSLEAKDDDDKTLPFYAELYGHKQLASSFQYLTREIQQLRSDASEAGVHEWEVFSSASVAASPSARHQGLPTLGTSPAPRERGMPLSPSRSFISSHGSATSGVRTARRRKPRSAAAESLLSRWEKALSAAEAAAKNNAPLPSLFDESVAWVPFDSQQYTSLRQSMAQRRQREAQEAKRRTQDTLQRARAATQPFSSTLKGSGRSVLGNPLLPLSQRGRPGAAAIAKAELTPVLLTTKDMQPYDEALADAEEAWRINNLDWEVDSFVQTHNKKTAFRFDRGTRAMLRSWFRFLDDDGSGEIEVTELEDPMLSTGLVANHRELTDLFNWIDTDGSGDIDVWEFMNALKPTAKWRMGDNGGSNLFGAGKAGGKGGSHFQREGEEGGGEEGKAPPPKQRKPPRIPTDGSVMSMDQLQAAFLPRDEASEGQSMTALLDLIAGGEQHLSIPTKLTAQRRGFLMSMIVSEQSTAVQARREIHRALTAAQAAQDHVTILRLRDLQRERDAVQLRKVERMKALRIIIDRKQREREEEEAASTHSTQRSRPSTGASSVLTESAAPSRPITASAEQVAAAHAALADLHGVLEAEVAAVMAEESLPAGAGSAHSRASSREGTHHRGHTSQSDAAESGQQHHTRRSSHGADAKGGMAPKVDTRVGAMQRLEAEMQAEASTKHAQQAGQDVDRRHASGAVGSQAAADAAWELEQALTGGSAAQRRRATAVGPGSFAALAEAHDAKGRSSGGSNANQRRSDKYAVRVPIEGWVEGGKMADMARVLAGRMI